MSSSEEDTDQEFPLNATQWIAIASYHSSGHQPLVEDAPESVPERGLFMTLCTDCKQYTIQWSTVYNQGHAEIEVEAGTTNGSTMWQTYMNTLGETGVFRPRPRFFEYFHWRLYVAEEIFCAASERDRISLVDTVGSRLTIIRAAEDRTEIQRTADQWISMCPEGSSRLPVLESREFLPQFGLYLTDASTKYQRYQIHWSEVYNTGHDAVELEEGSCIGPTMYDAYRETHRESGAIRGEENYFECYHWPLYVSEEVFLQASERDRKSLAHSLGSRLRILRKRSSSSLHSL